MSAVARGGAGRPVAHRLFAWLWRAPMPLWQLAFFVGPLLFMAVMTFWLVKNYRMEPAFVTVNWEKMFSRGYFWDAYWLTLGLAALSSLVTSLIALPASFALAFKVSPTVRRLCLFALIVPFFTSYLVRIFAWQVLLAEQGVFNGALGLVGLGPVPMLNSAFGTLVGYLTLSLPLVVILQTLSLANVDRSLVEAAWNLGCSRLRTVFTVILPLARIGLVVGALFCFILSFGDYVSPYYLGGSKPPTLSILLIDTTKSGQQWPRAAVVAITMIATLITVAFAAVSYAYHRRAR